MTQLISSRPQVKSFHLCPWSSRAPSTRTAQVPITATHTASHWPLCSHSNLPSVCAPLLPPVDLVQIPQAEALLHADCSGKEVTCEISHYFLQTRETTVETAPCFMANVQVSGGGPSISMVMKTPIDAKNDAFWHPTLNLPLSPQGTVRTAGKEMKSKARRGGSCL